MRPRGTRPAWPALGASALATLLVVIVCADGWPMAGTAQARSLTAGGFTTDASVTPASVAPGATATIAVSVTSDLARTALVDVEVYDPAGTKVFQQAYDSQSFAAGQQRSYPVAWAVPASSTGGLHAVRIGVFSTGWGTLYHWNNGATSFDVAATTPTPLPAGAPKRVMPLGDSLTEGYNIPGGYRPDLWSLVVADGLGLDFVGSLTGGPTSLPDRNHEGHGGWRIDEIAAEVVPWLTAAQPDIVLLMIGTNDMTQDYARATAPDRLAALVDRITATRPEARVVVASIPRLGWSPGDEWAQAYNAAIPGIVADRAARGQRVSYADVYAAVAIGDLHTDLTHLNASGNSKVAGVWFSAIRSYLNPDAPAATATATATPTASGTATSTATPTATPGLSATSTSTATPTLAPSRTPTPTATPRKVPPGKTR